MNARLALPLLLMGSLVLTGCSSRKSTGPGVVDADAPTEFTETESGLKYRILRKSDGPRPTANNKVKVDYRGWIEGNSDFDNSYNRRKPLTTYLADVIPGWIEGVQLIGEGGMIELEIPPELGYGERGVAPNIPPNATLRFKIELLEIL